MTKITENLTVNKRASNYCENKSNSEFVHNKNKDYEKKNSSGEITYVIIFLLMLFLVFIFGFSNFLSKKENFEDKNINLEELYELKESIFSYFFGLNKQIKTEYDKRINDISFRDFIFLYNYRERYSDLMSDSNFHYNNWAKHFYNKKGLSLVVDMTNKNYFERNELVNFVNFLIKENKILEGFNFIKRIEEKELNLLLSNVFFRKLGCDNYVYVIDGLIGYNSFNETGAIFIKSAIESNKYSNEEVYKQRKSIVEAGGISGLVLNDGSCILNKVINN